MCRLTCADNPGTRLLILVSHNQYTPSSRLTDRNVAILF